jgi:hypothetical protein
MILLSFSPISLVLGLLCAEALTTANLLATAEALIRSEDGADDDSTEADTASRAVETQGISFLANYLPLFSPAISQRRASRAQAPQRLHVRSEEVSCESSLDSSSNRDEYQDEDIDFRCESCA